MFVGDWHRRYLLGDGPRLPLEEVEVERIKLWKGGVRIVGKILGEEKSNFSGTSSHDSFDHLRASEIGGNR